MTLNKKIILIFTIIFNLLLVNSCSNNQEKDLPKEITYESDSEIIADPKGTLDIVSVENYEPATKPTSVGIDGMIYGTGHKNTLWRANNAFEEMEIKTDDNVYDFKSDGYGTPYFVTKTASGYVVVTDGEGEKNRGAIYYSEEFDRDYTLKKEFTSDHTPIMFGNTWYHGEYKPEQIVLIAERGDGKGKLWATFDGGKSWDNIRTAEMYDDEYQLHHHTAVYDPYQGRIWNSQGDGPNASIYISDDMGKSWRDISVETELDHTQLQPTLLAPTIHTLIYGGDSGGTRVGLLEIPRDKEFENNEENFQLKRAIGVWDQQPTYRQYATAPYAKDGSEIYIALPSMYDDEKPVFIVGSGDHGRTFHLLATHHSEPLEYGEQLSHGIVGPDKDGYLYGIWDTAANKKAMVVFDPPDWETISLD
ncbi:hypothetical protein [Natranaerobius trueperi]|uniref:Sortilin N-terminal domain-containing protein n=1 Tax=Natranaerobius trueperi TaxID=759412 RepID=A0A226BYE8_9FIRM|nr:hypothetical protein [Natranaerobius trueperi]OWZ83160.1 hypothetical protein CDO51_10035 [Natranaerobius trueperi]